MNNRQLIEKFRSGGGGLYGDTAHATATALANALEKADAELVALRTSTKADPPEWFRIQIGWFTDGPDALYVNDMLCGDGRRIVRLTIRGEDSLHVEIHKFEYVDHDEQSNPVTILWFKEVDHNGDAVDESRYVNVNDIESLIFY